MNFLELKIVGFLTPGIQILIICALFVWSVWYYYQMFKRTKKMEHVYPLHISIIFAPIYEEILFRGFILSALLGLYTPLTAVVVSSLLFGLWHFKNLFWEGKEVIYQMLYTGLFFGPLTAVVTMWSGSIWLAVMIHFIGNTILVPFFEKFFKLKFW